MNGWERHKALTVNGLENEEHVAFACLVVVDVDGSFMYTSIECVEKVSCNLIDISVAVYHLEEAGFFIECR